MMDLDGVLNDTADMSGVGKYNMDLSDLDSIVYKPTKQEPILHALSANDRDMLERVGNPTLFATLKAAQSVFNEVIPYARFLSSDYRSQFMKMTEYDQQKVLGWEAANMALFEVGAWGALPKAVKASNVARSPLIKTGSKLIRGTKLKANQVVEPGIKPVSDIFESRQIKPFKAQKAKFGKLRQIGFGVDEAFAVLSKGDLHKFERSKLLSGEFPSRAWSKNIEMVSGSGGAAVKQINSHVSSMIDTKTLLGKHRIGVFGKTVKGIIEGKPNRNIFTASLEKQSKRFGVKVDNPMDLAELNEVTFYGMIDDMMKYPTKIKAQTNLNPGSVWFANLTPVRTVAGMSEKAYGTWSKVYQPIKAGYEQKNLYISSQVENLFGIFEKNGLGKIKKNKVGQVRNFDFIPEVTKEVENQAFETLRYLDNLFGNMSKGIDRTSPAYNTMKNKAKEHLDELGVKSPVVHRLITSWHEMSDVLYVQDALFSVENAFHKVGMTTKGEQGLGELLEFLTPSLDAAFTNHFPAVSKVDVLDGTLYRLRRFASVHNNTKDMTIFKKGQNLYKAGTHLFKEGTTKKTIDDLLNKLTRPDVTEGKQGAFLDYFDMYFPRQGKDGAEQVDRLMVGMFDARAGYTMERLKEFGSEPIKSFNDVMMSRIYSQGNKMFFFEGINSTKKALMSLPKKHQEYYGHWLSRLRGLPSGVDKTIADWVTNAMDKTPWLPYMTKNPDARSIQKAGMFLNDLAFVGGLGFKPFSAFRNLFQTVLNTPVDLGGAKSWKNLGSGLVKLMDQRPTTKVVFDNTGHLTKQPMTMKNYLRDVGIIAEYLPEQVKGHRILNPHGMAKYINMDNLRDTSLWMFQKSDKTNRYWTGAAAVDRWDETFVKFGQMAKSGDSKGFLNKLGAQNRRPWIQKELQNLLGQGAEGIERAKRMYVRDVVADTQYLYGLADSPMIMSKFGAVGKTGGIFMSWGMNYLNLVGKAMRSGKTSNKLSNMTNFLLGGLIAGEAMNYFWGAKTAKRSVLGGAVTKVPENLPPAWNIFYHGIGAVSDALQTSPDAAVSHMEQLARGAVIFAPGGLQIKKGFTGYEKNRSEGLARSVFGFTPKPERYEPFSWLID